MNTPNVLLDQINSETRNLEILNLLESKKTQEPIRGIYEYHLTLVDNKENMINELARVFKLLLKFGIDPEKIKSQGDYKQNAYQELPASWIINIIGKIVDELDYLHVVGKAHVKELLKYFGVTLDDSTNIQDLRELTDAIYLVWDMHKANLNRFPPKLLSGTEA